MRISLRLALPLLLLVSPLPALAATSPAAAPPSPEALQAAATAFQRGEWQAAHDAYVALAARDPKNALARFRVGVTALMLGHAAEAEGDLRAGERLGISPAQAGYRLAQMHAELRQRDEALRELRRAYSAGLFLTAAALLGDPHLRSLASDAGFAALADSFDAVVRPCAHDPRYREFDFWLGDWDVRPVGAPAGTPASRNTVTLEDSACVIMEHWSGAGGSTGQSFNLFDRTLGRWRQTWVDNSGGQHDYVGGLRGRDMVFEGTSPAPRGQQGRIPTRLTFFHISADSVRQFSEISADSGRTWQPNYDFLYVRRTPR